MRNTPYKGYALYEPDASPDLTESGEYNTALMAVDADMHDEEQARIEADTALNIAIANEMAQRKTADDAINVRIDNAETEISANSADLTGIKGLTYGEQHVNFLENSNGEYSSPALEEISEQMGQRMACIRITSTAVTMNADTLGKLTSDWPNVVLIEESSDPLINGTQHTLLFPSLESDTDYLFVPIHGKYNDKQQHYATGVKVDKTGSITRPNLVIDPYWSDVQLKPFSAIGTGLKVVDDKLTVDTAAIPTVITNSTTWDEIESAAAQDEIESAAIQP